MSSEMLRFKTKPVEVWARQLKENEEVRVGNGTVRGKTGDWVILDGLDNTILLDDRTFRAVHCPTSRPS